MPHVCANHVAGGSDFEEHERRAGPLTGGGAVAIRKGEEFDRADCMRSLAIASAVAMVVVGLVALGAHVFIRATRTQPHHSPIVQAFLERTNGSPPDASDLQPIVDPRIASLRGLSLVAAKELLSSAEFGCSPARVEGASILRCMRDFASVGGPCFWNVVLKPDDNAHVATVSAMRSGHCPRY